MDTKITLSFDESVIHKAKRYAEDNNISLSRLTEFLLNKVTSKSYQSLEDLPIADWGKYDWGRRSRIPNKAPQKQRAKK